MKDAHSYTGVTSITTQRRISFGLHNTPKRLRKLFVNLESMLDHNHYHKKHHLLGPLQEIRLEQVKERMCLVCNGGKGEESKGKEKEKNWMKM